MSETQQRYAFVATDDDAGERLDRFLARQLPAFSRSRLKTLVKEGHARQDGRTIEEPNYRVKPGDSFEITVPPAAPAVPRPEAIPLDVVYEDDALIVLDKPVGLVVHPAAGNWTGTLVNALIAHCGDSLSGIGGVRRPGIVHRLDKETSGLMVVAKTDAAHQALAAQFADHGRTGALARRYTAIVWGAPQPAKGMIDAAIGRKPHQRQKMAVLEVGGKAAVTHYETCTRYGAGAEAIASQISCRLETGRTHQIRVHMAHIGHPLIGDMTYGAGFKTKAELLPVAARSAVAALRGQALHAGTLGFAHPLTGEAMRFESPLPGDLAALSTCLANLE
ncbi:MAG: RluA family pseudouridine synthase [Methyloligellaceae bacterium]